MKKHLIFKSIILFTSLILTACGPGGNQLNQPAISTPTTQKISLVNEPKGITKFFIRDYYDNIIQEPTELDSWSFSTRHQGGDILSVSTTQSNDSISKTGLNLNDNVFLQGNGIGSFFRSFNNNFESYIDTSSFQYEVITGAGPHSAIGYNFKNHPKVIGTTITADFSIPYLKTIGDSVGQLSIIGYLTDGVSTVAFVFPIFDNRYDNFEPYVMSDTFVSFVSQPIHQTKYSTPYTQEKMIKSPFVGYKSYGITFTENNLKNMIVDINIFNAKNNVPLISTNTNDYKLNLVGVLHEVFLSNNPQNIIQSGMSVKNIQVFQEKIL